MSTENLKELRNALSCWQDDYDRDDDKEQYDMFGAAIDAVSRLEAAVRERDEMRHSDYLMWHAMACKNGERARIAEAELAWRDAAAGEPVAFTHESEISNMHATGLYIRGFPADRRLNAEEGYTVALYTAALPVALPGEVEELSMLIRRLVHSLKNSNPHSGLLWSVPDFMHKKGYWKANDCLRGEND